VFCPACGTAVEAGDRFCEHCGRPLRPGTEEATAAQPQATGAPPGSGAYEGSAPSPGAAWGPEPPPPPYGWGPPASAPGPAASPSCEPSPYYGAPPYHGAPPSFQTYAGQAPPYPDYGSERSAPLAPFGAPLAGWWQRVGAMLLDGLIVGVPLVILNGVLNAAFGIRHLVVLAYGISVWERSIQGSGRAALILFDVVAGLLYFAILNGTRGGQTAGNHAPGIAVRDVATGRTIGFWRGIARVLVRAVLYAAFLLPGLLNDLFPIWDRRHQTIADKVARSVVIRLR